MFHVALTDLQNFLATYGYWAVFFFVAIESIGIPFPGETMLLVAAIDAGTTHQLSIPLVIVAATCGAIVGDNIGSWIGREGGYRVLRRYGPLYWFRCAQIESGDLSLSQTWWQSRVLRALRRSITRLGCLSSRCDFMPWSRFLLFNALGGFVWATLYGLGGYLLGEQIHR